MKRPISPRTHGMLDYATAGATAILARILGFSGPAARTARTWAAGYGALSALTSARFLGSWGFARDRRARNFFLGLAA
jgi:hypothetical protein